MTTQTISFPNPEIVNNSLLTTQILLYPFFHSTGIDREVFLPVSSLYSIPGPSCRLGMGYHIFLSFWINDYRITLSNLILIYSSIWKVYFSFTLHPSPSTLLFLLQQFSFSYESYVFCYYNSTRMIHDYGMFDHVFVLSYSKASFDLSRIVWIYLTFHSPRYQRVYLVLFQIQIFLQVQDL